MNRKTIVTVTAICLAAVLLCCTACFGTVLYVRQQNHAGSESAVSAAAQPITAGTDGGVVTTASVRVSENATLTGNQIYELACRQVVGISTEIVGYNLFGQQTSNAVSGTGFVISEDGYILTNNHVVEDAFSGGYPITVKFYDGSSYPAEIVGVEDDNDIAVLKIEATGLCPVTLGDSDAMQVGDAAYVVGNPLGELTYTMTAGIVSALDREIATSSYANVNMFQLDAAVNSGNSGGPVYNDRGQVIGVVTAKYQSTGVEGLGFAIPVNDAAAIARELIDHGYVTGKSYLGITVTTITQQEASRMNTIPGIYVYSVESGSCAEKAGMQQGDVITQLGDTEVSNTTELAAAKKAYRAGDACSVTVYRNGEYLVLDVIFDEEPPAQQAEQSATSEPPADSAPADEGAVNVNPWSSWLDEFFGSGTESEPEETPSEGFRHFGG